MMDYYSNFPPPSRAAAIEEVIKECKKRDDTLDDTLLRDTATKIVTEMPSLGSYAGWYAGFRGDAIKMVLDKIKAT
jgi:hypothetical protein